MGNGWHVVGRRRARRVEAGDGFLSWFRSLACLGLELGKPGAVGQIDPSGVEGVS
jgi:hypothetical protein